MTLLLDVDELPDQSRTLVLTRAEGNPFFLEEIVRQLIDEGAIERAGGRWRATASLGSIAIPDTVHGVLAARIDLLEREERQALEYAAVVGRVFWSAPVARLLNGSGERIDEMLENPADTGPRARPDGIGDQWRARVHLQARAHTRRGVRATSPRRSIEGARVSGSLDRGHHRGPCRFRRAALLPLRRGLPRRGR